MSAWTIPSYAEWAVPGYTEDRLLGHGVSGRVVAAASDATGRPVAIKYLDTSLVRDPEFLWALRTEAEQLKTLDAPHMVRLLDFVEQPGEGAAVVTELVEGVSLREMITRRGPLSAPAGLVVLKDSLIALAAAHAHRVAHRDVKPDNVLIDATGWCTLTDFGVAVKADHSPAPGTPAYMAPELWNGGTSVPSTDLYAATAVLYESVTGKPPFSGRPGQLRQHHESTPAALDQVDPPLHDLVLWGLAKNPGDRPRSARAFIVELDARASAAYGPAWEDEGRRELAERSQALLPLLAAGGGGGSVTVTRTARRKLLTFIAAASVAVVALAAVGVVALTKLSGNTQLSSSSTLAFSAQVTATPPVVASTCKTATTFAYKGTVTATETGTVSYRWVYSSGRPGALQTLSFTAPGHRTVSGGTVKTSKAGKGWGEIKVLSPIAKTSNRATYSLLCGAGDGNIALSAAVTPAAQTVSSCAAAAPALTATGSITSKKKGTLSYYWALGNGQTSAAHTLTFAAPGTLAAAPMSITPPALPATGTAELVVTQPAAATSSPAAYSVSCKVPATAAPSAAARASASAPAPGKKPAGPSASASTTSASPSPSQTSPSPSASATSPAPTPTPTTPTATPTTSSPTPTPTPTTPTPTPTPTTPTPTPTTSSPTASAPVSTPSASTSK
jgi:hypothetical protein